MFYKFFKGAYNIAFNSLEREPVCRHDIVPSERKSETYQESRKASGWRHVPPRGIVRSLIKCRKSRYRYHLDMRKQPIDYKTRP